MGTPLYSIQWNTYDDTIYNIQWSFIVPVIIVRKELFNENRQHSTQAVVFMVLKVGVLEHLILSFQTIICVNTNNEALTTEGPYPFL